MTHQNAFKQIRSFYKRRGLRSLIYVGIKKVLFWTIIDQLNYLRAGKPATFSFEQKTYTYFFHAYNVTFDSERAVEVPIICDVLRDYKEKNVLEVGNVLSHYFDVNHDIVDKYEKGKSIINQDIIDFQPDTVYDLIVSISTLEHVGWDEHPYDTPGEYLDQPDKVLFVVQHLKKLLKPRGQLIFTVPLGSNQHLDKLLRADRFQLTRILYLKRISKDNRWEQVDNEAVQKVKYGVPFPGANGLAIGIFTAHA